MVVKDGSPELFGNFLGIVAVGANDVGLVIVVDVDDSDDSAADNEDGESKHDRRVPEDHSCIPHHGSCGISGPAQASSRNWLEDDLG